MASAWHYIKDGKPCGPTSCEELRELASSGQVQPTDCVWKEGMADWVPASELPEFEDVFPEPATPPPLPLPSGPPPYTPTAQIFEQDLLAQQFSMKQRRRRILLIVASGIVVVCFFLPLFYVYVGRGSSAPSSLSFGWNLWFGIVCFMIGLLSLAGSIVDLALQRILLVRYILRWVHLGTFIVITLCAFLGTLLGMFGVGMSVYVRRAGWQPLHDLVFEGYSSLPWGCVPIMSLILIGGGVLGLVTAIKIVRGDRA